jgi:hypothetical protein
MTNKDLLIKRLLDEGRIYTNPNAGKVYSSVWGGKKELPGSEKDGYRIHRIRIDGSERKFRAHRIIYISVHGSIQEGKVIDHIDRNRANNKIRNLRCASHRENAENRVEVHNENHHLSKLTNTQRIEIFEQRYIHSLPFTKIGAEYGISRHWARKVALGIKKQEEMWAIKLLQDDSLFNRFMEVVQ